MKIRKTGLRPRSSDHVPATSSVKSRRDPRSRFCTGKQMAKNQRQHAGLMKVTTAVPVKQETEVKSERQNAEESESLRDSLIRRLKLFANKKRKEAEKISRNGAEELASPDPSLSGEEGSEQQNGTASSLYERSASTTSTESESSIELNVNSRPKRTRIKTNLFSAEVQEKKFVKKTTSFRRLEPRKPSGEPSVEVVMPRTPPTTEADFLRFFDLVPTSAVVNGRLIESYRRRVLPVAPAIRVPELHSISSPTKLSAYRGLPLSHSPTKRRCLQPRPASASTNPLNMGKPEVITIDDESRDSYVSKPPNQQILVVGGSLLIPRSLSTAAFQGASLPCPGCDASFTRSMELREHYGTEHGLCYLCPYCKLRFGVITRLGAHLIMNHKLPQTQTTELLSKAEVAARAEFQQRVSLTSRPYTGSGRVNKHLLNVRTKLMHQAANGTSSTVNGSASASDNHKRLWVPNKAVGNSSHVASSRPTAGTLQVPVTLRKEAARARPLTTTGDVVLIVDSDSEPEPSSGHSAPQQPAAQQRNESAQLQQQQNQAVQLQQQRYESAQLQQQQNRAAQLQQNQDAQLQQQHTQAAQLQQQQHQAAQLQNQQYQTAQLQQQRRAVQLHNQKRRAAEQAIRQQHQIAQLQEDEEQLAVQLQQRKQASHIQQLQQQQRPPSSQQNQQVVQQKSLQQQQTPNTRPTVSPQSHSQAKVLPKVNAASSLELRTTPIGQPASHVRANLNGQPETIASRRKAAPTARLDQLQSAAQKVGQIIRDVQLQKTLEETRTHLLHQREKLQQQQHKQEQYMLHQRWQRDQQQRRREIAPAASLAIAADGGVGVSIGGSSRELELRSVEEINQERVLTVLEQTKRQLAEQKSLLPQSAAAEDLERTLNEVLVEMRSQSSSTLRQGTSHSTPSDPLAVDHRLSAPQSGASRQPPCRQSTDNRLSSPQAAVNKAPPCSPSAVPQPAFVKTETVKTDTVAKILSKSRAKQSSSHHPPPAYSTGGSADCGVVMVTADSDSD